MTSVAPPKFSQTVFARITAFLVFVVSLVVLAGWVMDISYLKSLLPNFPVMKPNTAVAFALTALGIFCFSIRSRSGRWVDATVLCGVCVYLIGSVTLAEYIVGINVGIDRLFVPGSWIDPLNEFPVRMSPHSAINFTIIGIVLTLLNRRSLFQRVSEFLSLVVSITTFASVLGYLYGAEQLYGVTAHNSMAIHTAGMFFLCSVGLLAANPNSQTVKLLVSSSSGGKTARKMLPTVILIPTIAGWLRVLGQERGIFDSGFGEAFSVFWCVVLMFGLVMFFCSTIHITDKRRMRVEQEMAEKERQYRDLFDYGQGMICIHDLSGTIITVNPATFMSLGYQVDEMVGKNLAEFLPDENKPQFAAYLRKVENEGLASGYLSLVAKNDQRVVWRYHNILVSETEKEPYILGHAQDVTALLDAQKQLKNLSLTDELTGLYNRRGFLTMAEQQIRLERHAGTARGLTLMFADMDGLKQINDVYGHEAGSEAIIQLSKIFSSALRSADLVARWGGDEFVILTIGSQDENIELMIDRINRMIAEFNVRHELPYPIACSIGIAPVAPDGSRSFESIVAAADESMYEEKRRRKANRDDQINDPVSLQPNGYTQPALDLSSRGPIA